MRKWISIMLAVLLMAALIPTAWAADSDISITQTSYRYYVTDNKEKTGTTNGAAAYVQARFEDLIKWQMPGAALTGNPATWGTWIEVTATVKVKNAVRGTEIWIDGAKYKADANGAFTFTFYAMPVAGGSSTSRPIVLHDAAQKLIGRATISLIYEDLLGIKGTVSTEGINQSVTGATIENGAIIAEVIFSKLQAVPKSTKPTDPGYLYPDYFPVRIRVQLTDNDGNKFPAFTRVDFVKVSSSDLKIVVDQVPNIPGTTYLNADSQIVFEKQFLPGNAVPAKDILEIYQNYGISFGFAAADLFKDPFVEGNIDGGAKEALIKDKLNEKLMKTVKDAYAGIVADDNAWVTDVGGGTKDTVAAYTLANFAAGMKTQLVDLITATEKLLTDPASYAVPGDVLPLSALDLNYYRMTDDKKIEYLRGHLEQKNTLFTPAIAPTATTAIYDNTVALLKQYQKSVDAYTAEVKKLREDNNYLPSNSNIAFNKKDEINLRLTNPSTGKVSAQTVTIEYRSVSRITPETPKRNITLEGGNVTVTRGESTSASAKVYQDGVATTSIPVKYQSLDTSIVTALSATGSISGTFTGVKAGQAIVRAYVEETSGGKTSVIAEAYMIVTVSEPKAPEPSTHDYVCKVRKLYIRTGPGTNYSKAGYLVRNDIIKVIEVVGGWAKFEFNGKVVYSSTGSGKYLQAR